MCSLELENEKNNIIYIWGVGVCTDGWRVLLVNIYIYICLLFVGNNGVLLEIKFMFKNKNERIEVLNKKEVKFFLYYNYESKLISNIEINYWNKL